jgi:hypothetical protein
MLKQIETTFDKFLDGTRVLLLMCRTKDGGHNKEYHRRVMTLISHNREKLLLNIAKCLIIKEGSVDTLRLYMTCNSRDIKKAERNFKIEMLEMDFSSEENKHIFYERLEGNWASALMKPSARVTKYFLLDVDNVEGKDMYSECIEDLQRLNIEIIDSYKTKNGFHIITNPFNPTLFKYPAIINKDGQLLLAY